MTGGNVVAVDQVQALLVARIRSVMALDDADIGPDTRFDEDLHADSLDLVEVIEAVERDLVARGVRATLPDEDLTSLRTVGDAAARIAALARPGAEGS
jgi:acyl carrier protein